jgi:5-methylcytosine-specific restriction endonuclease McrA
MGYSDWSFKDPDKKADKFLAKEVKKQKRKRKKEKKKKCKKTTSFYMSDDWRKLRYRVLRKYKARCMCCGRNRQEDGIKIHVDHIKPRSKHPKLELDFNNLQILCEDCNLGKSNIDDTDWRPDSNNEKLLDEIRIEKQLDDELLINSPLYD